MTAKSYYLIIAIFLLPFLLKGQDSYQPESARFSVEGIVFDKSTRQPMEYATVSVVSVPDSTIAGGTVTGKNGNFKIDIETPGKYQLHVRFIGFDRYAQSFTISSHYRHHDAGKIHISPAAENLNEVTVSGNKNAVEYQIDKKVVHVSEQYTAISGNAADVLANVPSVQVDIEGNVTLRGNANFTVLIDDRPTILEPAEALQQIPAGMIQDIEIITNPSAKYDPEGTAGIINIITKKRSLEGISGIIHLNAGLDKKYGSDFLLNYKAEKFKVFVSADYNYRNYPGNIKQETETFDSDTTFFLHSEGDRERLRESLSAKAGFEFYPTDNDVISISSRYGKRTSKSDMNTDYSQWNSFNQSPSKYQSIEDNERGGNFVSLNSEYSHKFNGDREHKFDVHLMAYQYDGSDESINTLKDDFGQVVNSQKSGEAGPSQGFRYRVNYKRPLSATMKMEAGAQGRYRDAAEDNTVYYLDIDKNEYELQEKFSHNVEYFRNIHAGYALMNGEYEQFGWQAGFRAEYTYRKIELKDLNDDFTIDRWDYFPTLHLSYKLHSDQQLMASYSRRIDRPRGWYLEPFITWSDAYNVRQGNPDLKPEYIDSYEIGYQKEFGKNAVSMEIFYRTTENRIERVRSVYRENIMMRTFENVGTDYSFGTEVMLNTVFRKKWESNFTGNFFNYRIEGKIDDVDFERSSLTWSVRWNNIINITKTTRLQLNPAYHGREVEAREVESGFFYMSGAIRQSLADNKITLTLQVRDIFATAKHESETDAPDFYSYRLYTHKSPMVMLNFTWRINNYKNRNREGGDFEGGMDMD